MDEQYLARMARATRRLAVRCLCTVLCSVRAVLYCGTEGAQQQRLARTCCGAKQAAICFDGTWGFGELRKVQDMVTRAASPTYRVEFINHVPAGARYYTELP